MLPESKEITLGSIQYIAKHDELLQPIVFNFIEYLTSTLCINLHLGYHCTRLPPSSSLPCAPPLYLDSDYFSVSVLDPQSSNLPHSLPKNQRRAFGTRDSVSNQGPSQQPCHLLNMIDHSITIITDLSEPRYLTSVPSYRGRKRLLIGESRG
jgi:hypothetical protein